MKNKIVYIVLVIFFIVLLIGSVFVMNKVNKTNNAVTQNTGKSEIEKNIAIEVNNNNFEDEVIKEEKTVIVDFYATWCGPCKMLSPILEEVAIENSDIKLVKVDVDKNEKLVTKYNIQAMPTLIVFKEGKIVNRNVGAISKEKVMKLVNK